MLDARTLVAGRVARYAALTVALMIMGGMAAAFVPTLFGRQVMIVTSRSMEPWAEVGGVVITRAVDSSAVGVGDVITYRREGQMPTTHRIVEVIERSGSSAKYITQGDANEDPDPQPVLVSGNVTVAETSIPLLGRVLVATRTPFAVLAFLVLGLSVTFLERTLTNMGPKLEPAAA